MNKKRFTFLAALFIAVSIFGQSPEKTTILAGNNQKMAPVPSAPEKISYQAVVRDAANAIVANKLVGMRISIVQSGSNSAKNQRPSAVYEETQTPTTNANGLLSIYIGAGTGSDDFSAIDWSALPHYITIEIDPTGNNGNYTITGTTQLASVPYALYAKTSSDAEAVAANTAKVGYTEALVSANTDVAANTAKVGYTEALVSANTDVAANTAKVGYSEALVSANTDVAANTAKVGYTEAAVSANTDVAANTAKVGVTTHAIGDSFGGGIVFFVYDGGQHGLIAATADQSTRMRWYGGSYTNTRARADGIGAGLKNTAIIIANQGPVDGNAFAATVCNEYSVTVDGVTYGDWYLPSKHELNLLYIERAAVGGFTTNYYWSSTEYGTLDAWLQIFNSGYQFYDNKASQDGVRAVRAF
jgi:hypothetical protein